MKWKDLTHEADVCNRVGAPVVPPLLGERLGLSRAARTDVPLHGLRVPPTPGVSGWYIWSGERTDAPDFFEPTHIGHIPTSCPLAAPFLCLPPGWRFLTDGDYVDVWFDARLLTE